MTFSTIWFKPSHVNDNTLERIHDQLTHLLPSTIVTSTNGWPSVNNDMMGILGQVGGMLLPPGFDYKTFMYPLSFWMTYE